MRGLVGPVAQVRRIVPEPVDTDAHARRDKVPQIHFPQENPVAVELVQYQRFRRAATTLAQVIPVLPLQPASMSTRSKWVPTRIDPAVLAEPVRKPLGLHRKRS